jgi:hypothetical protein
MKYRRLSLDELEALTESFIHFLAANGIAAEDWETIKTANRGRMDALLDEFSDLVFQSTIDKANYFLMVENQSVIAFYCAETQLQIHGVSINNAGDFDLANFTDLALAFAKIPDTAKINVFSTTRAYKEPREREIFLLLENHCGISSQEMFEFLGDFVANKK